MADDSMPTNYDTQKTTTTTTETIGFHPEYVKTIPGILKIVEIVLSFIVFICASVKYFGGSGWVIFVALSAFITTLVALILYLLGMGRRWHLALLIEFIYYAVITLFFLIAAIVCAARGFIPAVGAAAFFAFAATAVFAVDTFFQFREWRAGGGTVTRSTAATTTTTTTVESQPQY